MTNVAVVHTDLPESTAAGISLGLQISENMLEVPDVVILFAAPSYNHKQLLTAIKRICRPNLLVGCSSAGEFTSHVQGEGLACAVALCSDEMIFSAGLGRGIQQHCLQAACDVVKTFRSQKRRYPYRSALVLSDALQGYAEQLLEHLTYLTHGTHQFFGGGAGDNAQFHFTPVFYDTEVYSDAVVTLEILSKKPVGIGVRHGWRPASQPIMVTKAEGLFLNQFDGRPAVSVCQEYAEATGQYFEPNDALPFFLHNLIGIDLGQGYKLRVPLAIQADGSLCCAAEVPTGASICFMRTASGSAEDAALKAVRVAQQRLYGEKPSVALFFDCVATRLRMGREFGFELQAVQEALGETQYVGCNSHGQIARAEGQLSCFHNCTAVVCLLPS